VVRECEKGAAGFDHDHFSKQGIAWSRYDINAHWLLLAEWPGTGLRKGAVTLIALSCK
jgi:hypothetical protein